MVANDIAKNVINQLHNLDLQVSKLLEERASLRIAIEKIKTENKLLENKVTMAISEINDYLKELEKIKAYYVDSNNNNK